MPQPTQSMPPGEARLVLYQSVRSEVREEALLLAFNAIVASVGGSLGLFLGVSCLSVAQGVAGKLLTVFCRNPNTAKGR